MDWLTATNGWGPAERDRANYGAAANDGGIISINGRVFSKGRYQGKISLDTSFFVPMMWKS